MAGPMLDSETMASLPPWWQFRVGDLRIPKLDLDDATGSEKIVKVGYAFLSSAS
jgi:hypothetical protein